MTNPEGLWVAAWSRKICLGVVSEDLATQRPLLREKLDGKGRLTVGNILG